MMAAVMTVMHTARTAGSTGRRRPERGERGRSVRRTGAAGAAGAVGTAGECVLKDALQLGGLLCGQLAARNFAGNQAVDLRLDVAGSGRLRTGAARTVRSAAL